MNENFFDLLRKFSKGIPSTLGESELTFQPNLIHNFDGILKCVRIKYIADIWKKIYIFCVSLLELIVA